METAAEAKAQINNDSSAQLKLCPDTNRLCIVISAAWIFALVLLWDAVPVLRFFSSQFKNYKLSITNYKSKGKRSSLVYRAPLRESSLLYRKNSWAVILPKYGCSSGLIPFGSCLKVWYAPF